jgi:hypothetical protein
MARTALTVNQIPLAGLADPSAATGQADGHKFANDGYTFLEFNNASGSSRVVTIQTAAMYQTYAVADHLITVPGSASRFKSGKFDKGLFNIPSGQTDAGYVYVDYPAGQETDITVRAFKY